MTDDEFVCVLCGDTMHVRFEATHWYLCQLSTALAAPDVERLITELT